MQEDGRGRGYSREHPYKRQGRILRSNCKLGSSPQKVESIRREQARMKSGRLVRRKIKVNGLRSEAGTWMEGREP